MTHAPIRSFRATTAICAVLALGSTAAWAQDAAPPLDLPAASAPASPSAAPQQPTLQLPTDAPAPPIPSPSVVDQPAAAAAVSEAASTPAKQAPVRSTVPRHAEHAAAAAPAASAARIAPAQPNAPAPRVAEPIPPAASLPLAQPAVAPAPVAHEAPSTADSGHGLDPMAWIAALLVALGAGTAGIVALRSRRRREEAYDDAQWAEPAVAEPAAIEPTPHPSAVQEIGGEEFAAAPATVTPAAEATPFAMPAGPVPQARSERDALLEEMVAAPPDAENPFTSRKARLRRARIILQSREHEQKQDATKPFDWRTYKPSTSHPAPATPPRVTV